MPCLIGWVLFSAKAANKYCRIVPLQRASDWWGWSSHLQAEAASTEASYRCPLHSCVCILLSMLCESKPQSSALKLGCSAAHTACLMHPVASWPAGFSHLMPLDACFVVNLYASMLLGVWDCLDPQSDETDWHGLEAWQPGLSCLRRLEVHAGSGRRYPDALRKGPYPGPTFQIHEGVSSLVWVSYDSLNTVMRASLK